MKQIKDFAVSSQEAGFDEFLKVYNEYFKFDFFGNAKFYGAKNGENYQTGQAWITPITPSQAIALLTNQTTDKMNTLANTCFQYDGSDDSKNIIRIMNKNHRSDFKGNDKYFYWIANNIADTFYKMDKDLTEIPPYEYLALLTGKQLTEGDLIVGNRFECIEDSFLKHFTKGLIYPCEKDGTLESNSIRWSEFDSAFLNRHFKLLPTQESVNEIDTFIADHDKLSLKMANEEISHLQQQLNTLTSEIKRFQEKYDENGYDCSNEIKLLRIENHIDFTLSFYHKEVTDLQQQLKEAKELLTLFADAKGVYQDNINKANQFLTRNK